MKQTQLNVSVPEALKKRLRLEAAKRGTTVQAIAVEALSLYLKKDRKP